jgi:hypothetical protein
LLEDLGIFYGNLVCSTTIWNIMWPFGILYGYLVCFFPFWYVVPRKIWQPWFKSAQGRKARPKRIQKVFFSKRFYSKICARSRTILGLLSWYCPLFDFLFRMSRYESMFWTGWIRTWIKNSIELNLVYSLLSTYISTSKSSEYAR